MKMSKRKFRVMAFTLVVCSSIGQCFVVKIPNTIHKRTMLIKPALNYKNDRETDQTSTSSTPDIQVGFLQETNATVDMRSDDDDECNTQICEKQLDYVGAGTLGDIMSDPNQDTIEGNIEDKIPMKSKGFSDPSTVGDQNVTATIAAPITNIATKKKVEIKSGLITTAGGTLTSQFGDMSPLDRIALTANGNLQRIFSSFYDAPVHVHVDKCVRRKNDSVWDRIVHLSVFDQNFCKATSAITVHSPHCVKIVESGEIGIGQLFRYLDKLPIFTIVDAGRNDSGGLWRKYTLECSELTCEILEEFTPDAWSLQPGDLY